ncbi:hypothetical protein [Opitutus terrae]|uniref:Transcriptional regulator n=1 Tax=Opitutus terrae (strain DSM 11246 / JCM 15787 / PB90-1) TaxID=452637 RepID=B1ZYZ3_OPITP|nr:hypothetical protein [Opitutus terrae]ACB76316.1 hypothetical protein Oter_3036 [Opitutus terrae PB90-1]
MSTLVDRKTFLRTTLGCAAQCLALASCPTALKAAAPATPDDPELAKARAAIDWLAPFINREEKNLDRAALVKLLEERGRLCCRTLDFRQKLIHDSAGDVDKLVELMGKIVGPENCVREADTIRLTYPMATCGCGRSPVRAPTPDDPFCECSKSNNRTLFEIVSGRPVQAQVIESPRRGGQHCRFVIQLG